MYAVNIPKSQVHLYLVKPSSFVDPSGHASYLASRDLRGTSLASHNFIVVHDDIGTKVFSFGRENNGTLQSPRLQERWPVL